MFLYLFTVSNAILVGGQITKITVNVWDNFCRLQTPVARPQRQDFDSENVI